MIHSKLQRALEDMRAGRLNVALAAVQKVLKRNPRDHDAAQILGLLLVQAGRLEEALPHLAAAVRAQPTAVQYRNNYANTLLRLERRAEAVEQWECAVQLDPGYALGWLGLAAARIGLQDSRGARVAAERGLRLQPGWPQMTEHLAIALEAGGASEQALGACERALAANPHEPALRSIYLLLLNYRPDAPERIFRAHQEFGRRQARPLNPPRADATPGRPLRIGVLSADLRTHSVAFFAEPILRHAPPWAALTVFSTSATPNDRITQRLRGLVQKWSDVGPMEDAALNRAIREQKIDVLLDLQGHTGGNRLPALADKPAPVIVTALGYPNTTGLPAIDWRLVDAITDPPGAEALATERLLRLDPCFLCYAPPADAPEPAMPPADAPITFGSFNALSKISDPTIALWSRVLAAVAGSRLLLKTEALSDPAAKARLMERLAAAGIAPDRVEIVPHAPTIREHLAIYGRIHVALDTTPYNGTTTTCEALWMGVPVVCLAGDRHAARVGASLLTVIGHEDLLARSPDDYVAIAARLANDRALLGQLRAGLRQEMRASPLLDGAGYAARFYAALRACWADWCAAQGRADQRSA